MEQQSEFTFSGRTQSISPVLSEESHLEGLNPPQREAVEHFTGPILVLAGAGSGKTRVLTHRISHLVLKHGVSASNILAVTFTNKAAEEMKSRLNALLGAKARGLWMSTFHSACLRILRHNAPRLGYKSGFAVYDDQDGKAVIKDLLKELSIDEKKFSVDFFRKGIDSAKNDFRSPEDMAKTKSSFLGSEYLTEVYDRYQKRLFAANAMDFGDLLVNAVRLLKQDRELLEDYRRGIHFILVDEFQDTNQVQYLLLRLLAEPRKNLFVVGDDDQSIYAFRGANLNNILNFERDYPGTKVVKLEQNYRSTSNILSAAHAVIEKNKNRKGKKLWTAEAGGDKIIRFIGADENDEAEYITSEIVKRTKAGLSFKDFAILYRTNAQTRALEEALGRRGVPYRIFGGLKFFDRKEIKDILAYLKLLINPSDDQAFLRVVNTPPRGIGAQAVQAIADKAVEDKASLFEASKTIAVTHKGVAGFVNLMDQIKNASETLKLSELIAFIVEKSEYGPKLAAMKDPQAQARIENLSELESLGRSMEEHDSTDADLRGFLDRIALTSSADIPASERKKETKEEEAPAVSLMTLHLAKGLEFPVVFFSGLEEGLLPHYRSLEDREAMEEERRLCYVGITRAKKSLYLTRAYSRGMFATGGYSGSRKRQIVSRFMRDIDSSYCDEAFSHLLGEATFLDGVFYEADEDTERDNFGRSRKDREAPVYSKTTALSHDRLKALLKSADTLPAPAKPKNPVSDKYLKGSPLLKENVAHGVKVLHQTFGDGVIVEFVEEPREIRLTVKFDNFETPKKLLFTKAKLVREEE